MGVAVLVGVGGTAVGVAVLLGDAEGVTVLVLEVLVGVGLTV